MEVRAGPQMSMCTSASGVDDLVSSGAGGEGSRNLLPCTQSTHSKLYTVHTFEVVYFFPSHSIYWVQISFHVDDQAIVCMSRPMLEDFKVKLN